MRSSTKRIISILGKLTGPRHLGYPGLLLKQGLPATAQVLDLVEEGENRNGNVQVRLWVVLRMKGSTTYRHIQAVLNKRHLPAVGEKITIRYCPRNLSRVIVLYPN